jgi:hypothetical protein
MRNGRFKLLTLGGALLALLGAPVPAAETLYAPDTLIIPMDTSYQDNGMLEAYGLVYRLLLAGVPVDWIIEPGKAYGDVDFNATAEDLQTLLPVSDHGYRGGPFVVDHAYHDDALPVVHSWQLDHPHVVVHRAMLPFTADVARRMRVAPSIAVFADGKEDIAFDYLNAAAIPMSNGGPWPAKKDNDREYACPGHMCCPDCLDEVETAGPTTTSHSDGALFDASGAPRYCQFMSIHYGHPAPTPEVVAEVREFLHYPVHFFAEGQAVCAFENDPSGRFLTSNGLLAGTGTNDVDHYHSDDPFSQADGGFQNAGGLVPAFSLDTGSVYLDANVVMLSREGTALGEDDIWMNGYVDADPTKGKVSYLGGHKYGTRLPVSSHPKTQGTRYFLNSLFEAPCTEESGQPSLSTRVEGPDGTNAATETISVCYENEGPGIAFDAELALALPSGASFVAAGGGGALQGDSVVWSLGSLAADATGCFDVTVSFGAEGSFGFVSTLDYLSGVNPESVDSGDPELIRFGSVNLLRYGGVIRLPDQLPPNEEIFGAPYPADPSLDPARDTEVVAFEPALPFPNDLADLLPGSSPLVFYELEGWAQDSLRVELSGGKVVIRY